MTPTKPKLEHLPLSKLTPYARNARTHSDDQVQQIVASIREFGWTNPVLIDARGTIVAGHGRVLAAQRLGMKAVPCIRLGHLTPDQVRAYVIADNKLALNAGWDLALLGAELRAVEADGLLGLTGFSADELQEVLGDTGTGAPGAEADTDLGPDRAEEAQRKWKVRRGDIWELGNHLIACADSTDGQVWERLLQGQKAQLTHTDPPYGVSYQDTRGVGIANDHLQGNALADLVREALARCIERSRDDGAFYIWHATATRRDFEHALDRLGLQERQYLTWVKESFTLGRSDYHWQTEPCFYAEKAGHRAKWFGDRTQSTVWKLGISSPEPGAYAVANGLLVSDGDEAHLFVRGEKPKAAGKIRHVRLAAGQSIMVATPEATTAWQIGRDSRQEYFHPTQKPVEIAEVAVANSSGPGDVVLEPFSGSGSTLLACERLGRRARAVDIEPKFVAVALERWAIATGGKPARWKR